MEATWAIRANIMSGVYTPDFDDEFHAYSFVNYTLISLLLWFH